ncbi:hypothetical protein [Salipiger bermudensis]
MEGAMATDTQSTGSLIYTLEDKPEPPAAALAAFQHILASIVVTT